MGKAKKDSMVESGCWNGFVNGVPGDDSFHDVINLFDSMESLEGDNSVDGEDWEAQFQSLGPIPSEVLQGFAHVSQANNCTDKQGFWPNNFVRSDGTSELKHLPDVVEVSSDSSHAKKSMLFHTPSPISVLESSSYSAEKSVSTSPELLIPVRTRSKRQRRSTFCKWHLISPITPSEKTLNKKGKEKKRKKPTQLPEDTEIKENHQHMSSRRCTHCQATETPQRREGPMVPKTLCNAHGVRYRSACLLSEYRPFTFGKEKKRKKPSQLAEDSEVKENHQHMHIKICTHCQATKTPQWREGPMGPSSLCNACGVRYRSGRLLPEYRPLASPTFVPSLHSNSHRKVIQMRNKVIQESSMPELNPAMLPPPEIFPTKVMQMRNKVIQESSMPEMDPAPEFFPMKVMQMRNKVIHEPSMPEMDPAMLPPPEFFPIKVMQMRNKVIQESSMSEMNPAMLPPPEFFPMKVMQMRNEVVQESLVPEMDPAMSPPPEFVPMSSYLFYRI